MPTPVQHLVVANNLLADDDLPARARDVLDAQRAAFLFGNTAPDVQTVSGQTREATHFFSVPLGSDRPAHEAMFEAYTELAHPHQLDPAQAAFMAGYIAHLWLDVMWIRDIFQPFFGPQAGWSTFHDRLFLHNVLRAWCDRRDQTRLESDIGAQLSTITPRRWLPFTADTYLRRWRDVLVEQFAPGALIRTVQVFAERGHVAPEAFERILASEQTMDELIFSRLPRDVIDDFYARGLAQSRTLVTEYLDRGQRKPHARNR